jgi:ribosomal protein S18 acetylase RimI-like enzyme
MARRRTSYAWAGHVEAGVRLSGDAEQGLAYARTLAENNREWSRQAPRHGRKPFPLTVEELAEVESVSASTIRRRIAEARWALFGSLSDSGIYYRRAQEKRRKERGSRICRAPDCANALPARARASRRYCHPRCRRRHHYQRPRLAARANAAIVKWETAELEARIGEVRTLYGRACNVSSPELQELTERPRLAAGCPGFLSLAAHGEDGQLCAFAYAWSGNQSQWWWHPPLASELRRKRKPLGLLRNAFAIGELAVAREARGRGFGRALLERLLAGSQAGQATEILILLDAKAGQAAAFYRTLGFADLLSEFRFSEEGPPKRVMVLAEAFALTAPRARAAAPTRSSRAS